MLVLVYYCDSFTIESPRTCLLEVGHVRFGASYNYLGLLSIELELIVVGVVAHDVQGGLEPTLGVCEEVAIICDTYSCSADRAQLKAEVKTVEAREARAYVNFKVSTSTYMSLPIPFMLLYFPAQLPL